MFIVDTRVGRRSGRVAWIVPQGFGEKDGRLVTRCCLYSTYSRLVAGGSFMGKSLSSNKLLGSTRVGFIWTLLRI